MKRWVWLLLAALLVAGAAVAFGVAVDGDDDPVDVVGPTPTPSDFSDWTSYGDLTGVTFTRILDRIDVIAWVPDTASGEAFLGAAKAPGVRVNSEIRLPTDVPAYDPAVLTLLRAMVRERLIWVNTEHGMEQEDGSPIGVYPVYLGGHVEDEQTRQRFVDLAAAAFPDGQVVDELTVGTTATCAGLQTDIDALLEAEPVTFEANSYRIVDNGQATLRAVAELIDACPGAQVEIGGHTDDRERDDLESWSRDRAEDVQKQMIESDEFSGWERTTTRGYADTRPVASNATEDGRAANRRVTFTVF